MELTTFDVTEVEQGAVQAGDYVSLFGSGITLDDAARSAGTIANELLTSLGSAACGGMSENSTPISPHRTAHRPFR